MAGQIWKINWFADEALATWVPIMGYWVYSGICHLLMQLHGYRLHPAAEEKEKNKVPKSTVIKGVLLQQFLQALMALTVFHVTGNPEKDVESPSFIMEATRFLAGMLIMDTWQYFAHRLMHQSSFLYKNIHSWHHRLVVPYAFGALYNHPLEGFIVDTGGGALAYLLTGMRPRTSIYFITFATIKAIDDHSGLWFAGHPFHFLLPNNAAYHDIHHQLYGTKYNFSQPFFVSWDKILGTYMPYEIHSRPNGGFEARPKVAE